MRRLAVLPCPESWDRMQADGDGRFCERCQQRVTDVATLDEDGLDNLLERAEGGRVCVRFELSDGRPKTKLGLAAGLVVIALAGCATPGEQPTTVVDDATFVEHIGDADADGAGVIAGVIRTPAGVPLPNAIVILMSAQIGQRERITGADGLYQFEGLPPGSYTIQVLYAKSNISKITTLPEGAKFRAHFTIEPDADGDRVLLGSLVEPSRIDTTSASSTYSSRLLEY